MVLRMKNFNILGVHWKIWLLRGGSWKKQYRGRDCLKREGGLGLFADLRGGLARKKGVVFLRGGGWDPNANYSPTNCLKQIVLAHRTIYFSKLLKTNLISEAVVSQTQLALISLKSAIVTVELIAKHVQS